MQSRRGRNVGMTARGARRRGLLANNPGVELLFLLQSGGDLLGLALFLELPDAHAEERGRARSRRHDVGGVALANQPVRERICFLPHAERVIGLDAKNDQAHFQLGALYDENNNKENSIANLKKAIELNPQNAAALNYLGYTWAEMGVQLDEAEILIQRALKIEPNEGFYIDSLGCVYYQKGDYNQAVELLERAVEITVDDPTIIEHLADAYLKVSKPDRALARYREALKKSKEDEQLKRIREKMQRLERKI